MRAQAARLQLPDCPAPEPAPQWPTEFTFELKPRQRCRSSPSLSAATSVAARRKELRRACSQRTGARGQHGRPGLRAPYASLGPHLQAGMKAALMHLPMNVRRFLAGAFAGALRAFSTAYLVSQGPQRPHVARSLPVTGALSKTATAPIETVRMQMMTTGKVCPCCCPAPLLRVAGCAVKERAAAAPCPPATTGLCQIRAFRAGPRAGHCAADVGARRRVCLLLRQ